MRRATAPRLSSTAFLPLAPIVARAVGSASNSPTTAASSRRVVHDAHRAALDQHPRDVRGIEIVRARHDRQAERRGLEQVVAADGHQAAADERHVARGIERRQLAERIEQEHLRVRRHRPRRWCA